MFTHTEHAFSMYTYNAENILFIARCGISINTLKIIA